MRLRCAELVDLERHCLARLGLGSAELLDVGVTDRWIGFLVERVVACRQQAYLLGTGKSRHQCLGTYRPLRLPCRCEQCRINHPTRYRGGRNDGRSQPGLDLGPDCTPGDTCLAFDGIGRGLCAEQHHGGWHGGEKERPANNDRDSKGGQFESTCSGGLAFFGLFLFGIVRRVEITTLTQLERGLGKARQFHVVLAAV